MIFFFIISNWFTVGNLRDVGILRLLAWHDVYLCIIDVLCSSIRE